MAWVAVNRDGTERLFAMKPYRDNWFVKKKQMGIVGRPCNVFTGEFWNVNCCDGRKTLSPGTIQSLIGHPLTWQDEPVELKADE